jgi:anti-sigma factor RsiW
MTAEDGFNGEPVTGALGVLPGYSFTVVAVLVFSALLFVGSSTFASRTAEGAVGEPLPRRDAETSHLDRASCASHAVRLCAVATA